MSMQIVTIVDKGAVSLLKERLYSLVRTAKDVSSEYTFVRIKESEKAMHKARELYETLVTLDLLDELSITREDIDRMESKVAFVYEEKQGNMAHKWKGGNA